MVIQTGLIGQDGGVGIIMGVRTLVDGQWMGGDGPISVFGGSEMANETMTERAKIQRVAFALFEAIHGKGWDDSSYSQRLWGELTEEQKKVWDWKAEIALAAIGEIV